MCQKNLLTVIFEKNIIKIGNKTYVSKLTEEIELMVLLPEELKNAKDGLTRKFYIIREHEVDGKLQTDLLEAKLSEDGKYLIFKSDKFQFTL